MPRLFVSILVVLSVGVSVLAKDASEQARRLSAKLGVSFHYDVEVKGGIAPYATEIVSGTLPNGVELKTAEGKPVFEGTPLERTEDQPITIRVTDSSRPRASVEVTFAVTVEGQPLTVEGKSAVVETALTVEGKEARSGSVKRNSPPDPNNEVVDVKFGTHKPDGRGNFQASGYTGIAIDTFAADELRRYLNPGASGKILERGVFGFDFAYRLLRTRDISDVPAHTSAGKRDLWIYGETAHGTRSTDVDCNKAPFVPTCQKALQLPTRLPEQTLFMLRNATTLEAFTGLRYEFLGLNQFGDTPANLYVKAQAGFLSVAENGQDVVDAHHLGVGAIATAGRYEGSYVEFAFGRTDLFAVNRRRRFKIDGYLQRRLGLGFSFFTQMFVDSDLGRGSDAVQSYIGFNFDITNLFRKDGEKAATTDSGALGVRNSRR